MAKRQKYVSHVEVSSRPVDQSEDLPVRYRVSVECPTPLAANPLEIEATDQEDAWRQFCQANRIQATDWPVRIEEV